MHAIPIRTKTKILGASLLAGGITAAVGAVPWAAGRLGLGGPMLGVPTAGALA